MTTLASFSSAAFTTAAGVAVAATADIEVRNEDDGALASIFSDEAGTVPIAQPGFQTDASGRFIFYAAGRDRGYKVTVTKGAETYAVRHIAIGTAAQRDQSEVTMIAGTQIVTGAKTFNDITSKNPAQTAQTLTDAAPTTWDMDSGSIASWTMGASRSLSNPTHMKVGGRYVLKITQDATGGRLVTWGSAYKGVNGAGVPQQPNQVLNTVTYYYFQSPDGASLILVGAVVPAYGQCVLAKSGANLALTPKNGNLLTISGKPEVVPDAGVTLAPPSMVGTMTIATPGVATFNNHGLAAGQPIVWTTTGAVPTGVTAGTTYYVIATGLTANTFQFSATLGGAAVNTSGTQSGVHTLTGPVHDIYAFMSGTTMTLEAQLTSTAHALQAGSGVEIKSGDGSRSLVGKARTVAGAWTDSATQRFVRSWFNDPAISARNTFSADRSTSSTSAVEINSEIRIEFLTWSADVVFACSSGTAEANGVRIVMQGLAFDGATAEAGFEAVQQVTAANSGINDNLRGLKSGLSEGYHFMTLVGAIDNGGSSATWRTANDFVNGRAKTYINLGVSRGV